MSRRSRLLASLLLIGIGVGALPARPAHAQDGLDGFDMPGAASVCFGMLGISEARALAICDALALKENVKARELAQQWIAEQPGSAAAQFALAEVLVQVEGNLARALFHLNQAESLTNYASMGRAIAAGNAQWHFLTLSQLSYVHQLMGNQEGALAYLDKIEAVYGQEMESFRGWPLIKMQRFEEARASANEVLATSNDPRERSRALNTLCAAELASLRPPETLIACDQSLREDEALAGEEDGDVNTVFLMNAAEVALSMLRLEEAETYLRRATRYLNPSSVGDPWISLLYLTMNQSRFDEAHSALDNLLVWRDQQDPIVGVMNRAEHFLVSATFLMLAGYAQDAATLSATALNQPDRTGSFSADEAQKDSIAALINHMANRSAYEQKREEASWLGFSEALQARLDAAGFWFRAWRSGRHAAALFADPQTLMNRLRPYAPLDVHIPEWVEPDLIPLLGTGVIATILEQTREAGAFSLNEGYYYAYRAEISALNGKDADTLTLAARAMSLLPAEEVMLRARLAARVADAAWRQGDVDIALNNYEQALQDDPSVLRRLGLSLPVRLTAREGDFEREVLSLLERSPRFTADPRGLTLEVLPQTALTLCLSTRGGIPLSCDPMGPLDDTLSLEPAQQLVKEFHTRTFGLGYDIPQSQRMRLLGSSVILSAQNNPGARENRDTVLRP